MLHELARTNAASAWASGALIFFLVVFIGIAAWVLTRAPHHFDAQAALPLDDASPAARAAGARADQKEA